MACVMHARAVVLVLVVCGATAACSSNDDAGAGVDAATDAGPDIIVEAGPSCSSGGAGGATGTVRNVSLTVNGVPRTYVLDAPASAFTSSDAGCGARMLIGLHGAGDTALNFLEYTQLISAAAAQGFIVAAPQAFNGGWYLTKTEGWTSLDGNPTSLQNDVAFVLQIISDTSNTYNVDPTRIYACGWSRGGGFTGVLATASGNPAPITGLVDAGYVSPFAAYGISAGYDYFGGMLAFDASSPQNPIWEMHGTADTNVPFTSGQTFSNELSAAGWPVTFTAVSNAPHDWLWQAKYGYSDGDLWTFFMSHPY
jgi:poly(3-hydroxybutyrate) depolymerase